jgi:hypothetical protein
MADVAVLTRNFAVHLEPAVTRGGRVTFYSNVRWRHIEAERQAGEEIVVYFIVSEHSGVVTYEGRLDAICIPPVKDTAELEAILRRAPDDAARAAVQSGEAKTIYSISDVRRVTPPFAQTELLKRVDGKPVDRDYSRSYCVVEPFE